MALVARSGKITFYGIAGEGSTITYHRMKNFTSLVTSKNPKEYTRQYIDEPFEQSDITGYSPSIAYAFDLDSANAVHNDIVEITYGELVGANAVRKSLLLILQQVVRQAERKLLIREILQLFLTQRVMV